MHDVRPPRLILSLCANISHFLPPDPSFHFPVAVLALASRTLYLPGRLLQRPPNQPTPSATANISSCLVLFLLQTTLVGIPAPDRRTIILYAASSPPPNLLPLFHARRRCPSPVATLLPLIFVSVWTSFAYIHSRSVGWFCSWPFAILHVPTKLAPLTTRLPAPTAPPLLTLFLGTHPAAACLWPFLHLCARAGWQTPANPILLGREHRPARPLLSFLCPATADLPLRHQPA